MKFIAIVAYNISVENTLTKEKKQIQSLEDIFNWILY